MGKLRIKNINKMQRKEKPLPRPPKTPFGRRRRFEEEEDNTPLLADEIAKALAEGKLDEFMEHEIPDSEHARRLVSMMMGMTGIMPSEEITKKQEKIEKPHSIPQPSEEITKAIHAGNVKGLTELLKKEYKKRTGEETEIEEKVESQLPSPEKKIIDKLIKIASKNNVSIDWLILRALKMYLQGYKKTGRL